MLGCAVYLTACANLNTIERTTRLPDGAKAVHLDIQQRVLIMNELGRYCAEPSPDGLAAYAAALGVSASNPASSALSAAGSGGSAAASIGLRTQSITLMRDAMFRVCEAYANQAIGEAHYATMLDRSQNLTAVILAVEQLTGPMSASQAALTTTTDATASASLVAIGRQLELAMKQVELANTRLEEATARQTKVNQELEIANAEREARQDARDNADKAATTAQIAKLDRDLKAATDRSDALQRESESLEKTVELRKEFLASAQQSKEIIEQKQETAFASAAAGTSSGSKFNAPADASKLSESASIAIAGAVKEMVVAVLDKDYLMESCISVLTMGGESAPAGANIAAVAAAAKRQEDNDNFRSQCIKLIKVQTELKIAEDKLAATKAAVQTSEILSRPALDPVLDCVSDDGVGVDDKRLQAIVDLTSAGKISANVKASLKGRTAASLRGFLSQRPDVLNAMVDVILKDNSVCSN
ncbi:hypothetical protein HY30_06320 [Hyphomonas chukchiensis]|uniref:Uncharacterized protein n=2 Tax=Hyphomonas chukchiensis TaxID=1280947 RepID=A0A062UJJ6_9PROT|nr:hypothetical protein HY30_06320 [Hyphomonas chukchiensis]